MSVMNNKRAASITSNQRKSRVMIELTHKNNCKNLGVAIKTYSEIMRGLRGIFNPQPNQIFKSWKSLSVNPK